MVAVRMRIPRGATLVVGFALGSFSAVGEPSANAINPTTGLRQTRPRNVKPLDMG